MYERPTYARARHSAAVSSRRFHLFTSVRGDAPSPRFAISGALLPLFRLAKSRVAYFKFGTVTRGKVIAAVCYRARFTSYARSATFAARWRSALLLSKGDATTKPRQRSNTPRFHVRASYSSRLHDAPASLDHGPSRIFRVPSAADISPTL